MLVWGYDSEKIRPEAALSLLRTAAAPAHDRGSAGGPGRIHPAQVLRSGMHGPRYEQRRGDQRYLSLARSEASKAKMRGMRCDGATSRSPPRRELAQQRPRQSKDALPELSLEAALGDGRAFAEATVGPRDGVGWPSRPLWAHRGRIVARRCSGDVRAYLQSLGKTPNQIIAFRTLATRLATAGSAGAARLVRGMEFVE